MITVNKAQVAKILLVEDEPDMAQLVSNWLQHQHHVVNVIGNGDEALAHLSTNEHKYEVVILDIMLPGQSGIEVCQQYRNQFGTVPILMLTARNSIVDKETAFKVGADDYLTKPFHLKELSVRVNALLRRSRMIAGEHYAVDDIYVYFIQHKITKAGNAVHLTPKEFQLLAFLIKHPRQTFSSEELLKQVWGTSSYSTQDTVRGHINRLRRKLDAPGKQSIITSVHGLGYCFDPLT